MRKWVPVQYHSCALSNPSFLYCLAFTGSEDDELSSCEGRFADLWAFRKRSLILATQVMYLTAGQPWAICSWWCWLSQEGWLRWPSELPSNLNHSEILLSFWNITSLTSGIISEWKINFPVVCTDLEYLQWEWLKCVLYLVSWRRYERKWPTGGLGIDQLSVNKNKKLVDIFENRSLVTQGFFFLSDSILEACCVKGIFKKLQS